jgi:hypothetical protein
MPACDKATMSRATSLALACLAAAGGAGFAPGVAAAQLTRGPYLQVATPTSLTIRWRTDEPVESLVFCGTDPGNLHRLAGDLEPATEHEVALAGLAPLTRYYYAVGSWDELLAGGPDYFFVTAPLPGTPKPTSLWVIGDAGTAIYGWNQAGVRDAYYDYTGARYTDLFLLLGDNAYYEGTDWQYQTNFFDIYPTLLRQTPLWPCLGNHETYSGYWDGTEFRFPYLDIFTCPTNGEAGGRPSGTERYYSFDYANIHFVCLDSEAADLTAAGPMGRWLEADLAANTQEWLIAFLHRPPYSKGSHDSDSEPQLITIREELVPLLERYGLDLLLAGHSHWYERSFLLSGHYGYSWSLQPWMLLDAGSGRENDTGAYLKAGHGPVRNQGAVHAVVGSSGWATWNAGHHPVMFYDALQMGSMVIDIHSNRLDAVFLRETGAIDDSFTILKGVPPAPLRICTYQLQPTRTRLQWKSVARRIYEVQRATDLALADWTAVGERITASGATTTWENLTANNSGQSFYRVVDVGP